jgi:hypothetical protein
MKVTCLPTILPGQTAANTPSMVQTVQRQNKDQSSPITESAEMPSYQIGLQDGRQLQIEAESQDAALAGAQHYMQANPPSTGSDVATGVEKALAQAPGKVIGTPGDLEAGTDWLSNKASGLIGGALGVSPSTQSTMDTAANALGRIGLGAAVGPSALLGSGLTSDTINNATGANALPDAQTPLGQGAQLATGVASNPLSYLGPGGVLRSLGSSLGSAALSSGAHAGAKALGLSDGAADAAGGVAGFLMPSLAGKGAAITGDQATTAAERLLAAGGQGRDDFRGLNFATRDGVMQNWAQNKINQYGLTPVGATDPRGFSATAAPNTHAILNDIADHQGAAWAPDMSVSGAATARFGLAGNMTIRD